MLSPIEKLIILKTVPLFAETPEDVLAEVAALLVHVQARAGEAVVRKGDLGTSMFIIVSGRVRVHDELHTLNELGDRDVFGEMALVDPQPRIATVTCVEDTALLRLDQAVFFELMMNRAEVLRGIVRVLLGHLRARMQDISELQGRETEPNSRQDVTFRE